MGKDYYKILGIERNASSEEIKKAYKKLAKKYHPDVCKESDAEDRFKDVQEAYSVLGNPQKRKNFDQFGSSFDQFSGAGTGQGFSGFEGFNFGGFDFEDLFSGFGGGFGDIFDMFGRRQSRGKRRGNDIQATVNITFKEAVFGTEKKVEFERIEYCDTCKGEGVEKKSDKEICKQCNGNGFRQVTQRTMFGVFSTRQPCNACNGKGEIIKNPCNKCNGKGKIKVKKKINLKIPEGINSGNTLRMHGEGNVGDLGAGKGDLYVTVFAEESELFKRDGSDILLELPLSFSEAALGTELSIPGLREKLKLKVPAGTQSETVFRIKGKGIKELNSNSYGDQYVKVIVKTPEKINKKQKELLQELMNEDQLMKTRTGFFDRIMDKFL